MFHFHIVYTITPPVNEKIHSCFKKEDGDDDGKQIVYNTVGPNVCMGDHKVKTGLCNILTLLLRWTHAVIYNFLIFSSHSQFSCSSLSKPMNIDSKSSEW